MIRPVFSPRQIAFGVIMLLVALLLAFVLPVRAFDLPPGVTLGKDGIYRVKKSAALRYSEAELAGFKAAAAIAGLRYVEVNDTRKRKPKAVKKTKPPKLESVSRSAKFSRKAKHRRTSHRARDTPVPMPRGRPLEHGRNSDHEPATAPQSEQSSETAGEGQATAPSVGQSPAAATSEPPKGDAIQGLPEGKGEASGTEPAKPSSRLEKTWDWLRSLRRSKWW